MRKVFIQRAKFRSKVAYALLVLALLVITGGIFLAIDITVRFTKELNDASLQNIDIKNKEIVEIKKSTISNIKYKYTAFLVTLLSMLFFIAQTLLRLYRYNILKTDFYLACADSLILTQKFNEEEKQRFQLLLTTIISEKVSLTTPKSPTFSVFSSKDGVS